MQNKPDKASDVAASVDKVLSEGIVRPREVESLFGRIHFVDSQVLGRMGRLALGTLGHLSKNLDAHHLSHAEEEAFGVLRGRMLHGEPRRIDVSNRGPMIVVYTDGACEPGALRQLCTVEASCTPDCGASLVSGTLVQRCLMRSLTVGLLRARDT